MKKYFIYLIPVMILILISFAEAWEVKSGDLFHVTGCENGELFVPVVNMWSKPGALLSGAKIVGKLSGDGREDQGLKCQGAVVRALEIRKFKGRTFIKIKSIVNSKIGWIADSFVGRKFSESECETFFSDPEHIKNCLGRT